MSMYVLLLQHLKSTGLILRNELVTCVGQTLINFSPSRKSYLFPAYIQQNVFIYLPNSHSNLLEIKDSATLRTEFNSPLQD